MADHISQFRMLPSDLLASIDLGSLSDSLIDSLVLIDSGFADSISTFCNKGVHNYGRYSFLKQESPLVFASAGYPFYRIALAAVLQPYGPKAFRYPLFLLVPVALDHPYGNHHCHCLLCWSLIWSGCDYSHAFLWPRFLFFCISPDELS